MIMVLQSVSNIFISILLLIFTNKCDGIKCFDCNSANNSACLDLHMQQMHSVVPVVDCGKALPNVISKNFFCRKMIQTILHPEQTPEIRVTRSCGWIKHKRECYKADNKDHLETVCQCFGDMCNAATALRNVKLTLMTAVAAIFSVYRTWRWKA